MSTQPPERSRAVPISLLNPLLLAQVTPGPIQSVPTWAVISALGMAGLTILVLVPTVLGLRFARRQRELVHAERMRALELGHPLPGSEPTPQQAPGMVIGLWVPVSVFGIAFVATQSGRPQHEAWIAAAIVGTASVICGTILALRGNTQAGPIHPGKPRVDPAAYDELAARR